LRYARTGPQLPYNPAFQWFAIVQFSQWYQVFLALIASARSSLFATIQRVGGSVGPFKGGKQLL
jgi:hypothetical protein